MTDLENQYPQKVESLINVGRNLSALSLPTLSHSLTSASPNVSGEQLYECQRAHLAGLRSWLKMCVEMGLDVEWSDDLTLFRVTGWMEGVVADVLSDTEQKAVKD